MNARKIILDAMHQARTVLTHHVQTKHGREPEKAIEDLRAILESAEVNEAIAKLRNRDAAASLELSEEATSVGLRVAPSHS